MWVEICWNIYKETFSRENLSGKFRMLDSLNKWHEWICWDVWALWFWKYIIRKDFFWKAKSVLYEIEFWARTREEENEWLSNIAWYIDFKYFPSIKCLNLDKIAFALTCLT